MIVPCNFEKLMKTEKFSPSETRNLKPKFDLKLEEKKMTETPTNNQDLSSSARKRVTFLEEKKVINYEDKKNIVNFHSDYDGEIQEEEIQTRVHRKQSSKSKRKKLKPILVKKNYDQDLSQPEQSPEKKPSLKMKKKNTAIMVRNIKEVNQIESTYKATGKKMMLKERKTVQKKKEPLCEKFAKDPLKFFTSPTKTLEVENLQGKYKEEFQSKKTAHLRNCNSEKVFKTSRHNNTFEIIQNLRMANMSRQEKENLLKDLITKLNIESPSCLVEGKHEENFVNISYISGNEHQSEKSKESGKESGQ